MTQVILGLFIFMLIPAGDDAKNPWKERVAGAIAKAEQSPSAETIETALDTTAKADDLPASRKALELARENLRDPSPLKGKMLRALWRAGRLEEVEKLLTGLKPDSRDLDALTIATLSALSRSEHESALRFADAIAAIGPQTASQANAMFSARFAADRNKGIAEAIRKIEKLIDPANGYPDNLLGESVDGLAAFFDVVGDKPLNVIDEPGDAEMPLAAMLGVPRVDVMINGKGPYSLILDTGGSVILSLSPMIAEEVGLKPVATASVRGVGGKMDSGQAVAERVSIGTIELSRVMTRIYKMPDGVDQVVDGIVGTGMFSKGRMTLDFGNARLRVERSSEKAAGGVEYPVRLIGDSKIVAPVRVEGELVLAIVDSGAGANALSPSRLRTIHPNSEPLRLDVNAMGVGDGKTQLNLGPTAKLSGFGKDFGTFSGLGLEVLDGLLSPALGIQTDALIGMPMLREMKTFTIDYHRARLWVEW